MLHPMSHFRHPRGLSTLPVHEVIGMPSLSPTMESGVIGECVYICVCMCMYVYNVFIR